MTLNVVLDEGAYMPERAHAVDAGMDLRTPRVVVLPANSSVVIDTGVHIQIPEGYWGKLESKSGLNVRHGVVSLGGVIDSGYTGPITVKLYNFSKFDYVFNAGDKIVQLIIIPCDLSTMSQVEVLDATERGDGGFGSSGR